MTGGSLALFQWALRSDSRSSGPHLARFAFAAFMLFALGLATWDPYAVTGPGLRFFRAICWFNVLLISVSGISWFVSAVAEEKDAGSLALLRLAGMSSLGIVLGKSTSRLIAALMLLAVQIPFTLLAVTLGGITWQQVMASWVSLAGWMSLVCNLALLCSILCRSTSRAAVLCIILLLLYLLIDPLTAAFMRSPAAAALPSWFGSGLQWAADLQQATSVIPRLENLLSGSAGRVAVFGRQFFASCGLAAGLFLLSVYTFSKISDEQETLHTHQTRRRFLFPRRTGRCWQLPVAWKDVMYLAGGIPVLLMKTGAYAAVILMVWLLDMAAGWDLRGPILSHDGAVLALCGVATLLQLDLMLLCSGSLFHEVRGRTLAGLHMTPISTTRILGEKLAAVCCGMVPACVALLYILFANHDAVAGWCSLTMICSWIFVTLLCAHLTLLFSLYVRWAALPLAVLVSAFLFICCLIPMAAGIAMSDALVRRYGITIAHTISGMVNLAWTWLLVMLPIELEIRRRWDQLGSAE